MNTETVKKRLPYCCYLLALCDRICRNECSTDNRICLHELCGFPIPCSNIINFTCSFIWFPFFVHIDRKHIFFLLFGLKAIAYKRRIAHDIVEPFGCNDLAPIGAEGIAFVDVMVGFERKCINMEGRYFLRLLHHLLLSYPEGGGGYRDRKIVDLNAVELVDIHLNRIGEITQDSLPFLAQSNDLILQSAQ